MLREGELLEELPSGRRFAMAYPRSNKASPAASSEVSTRVWEDLRKEARKLEGEIDIKLAAYSKLCSGYDSAKKLDPSPGHDQLAASKTVELENLLNKLSDVNEAMSGAISGGDARSHTVARHREIHHDYTKEFRRLGAMLGEARDRSELLSAENSSVPLLGVQVSDLCPLCSPPPQSSPLELLHFHFL
mmetsp:Transcript_34838/g.82652  ORF Transcript_34838/g.82652 Transcript_34838/m.82652 type:complete len:189 (-) Transcript_34838:889-1455(-)